MKLPLRDFWSKLIVKFGECTYKSIPAAMFRNRRLRVEREDNTKISGGIKRLP